MKKLAALFLAILMIFSLVACGETNVDSPPDEQETNQPPSATTAPGREYDETDPAAVLGEITNDFADVTTSLTLKLEETFTAVGTTYEDYQKNKGLVDEWITLVLSESDALFTRTKENSIAYFKLIATDPDHKYSEFCDEALDEYYDTVYDKAMDEYYDSLYDNAMDDLYDEYYDGIIDDAYDDVKYEEWSNVSSECYKTWSDASSAIYKKWSDESSYVYGLWSTMSSAFCWNDNYDVDAIVAEYDKEKAEEEANEDSENNTDNETKEPTQSENTGDATDGIRPEFKEAMDSYEAFYTEYCEFMKEYSENPTDLTSLAKYSDMLVKAEEMNEAFEAWDEDELSSEELKYYLDVNNRVMKMLVDVS